MPWLKLLHITAVILWCGALLYMAAAIAAAARTAPGELPDRSVRGLPRTLYTLVAGPCALIAITSGTALFVLYGPRAAWLLAKLGLVALLVLGHAACGMLVLRVERRTPAYVRGLGATVLLSSLVWLAAIAWLVLHKPF